MSLPERVYFEAPAKCPGCASALQYEGLYLVCRAECSAQKAGAIRSWVNNLGILHFGEGIIEALVATKKIKDISGLYVLTVDDIAKTYYMDGRLIGETTARKAVENLHAQKTHPLWVILGSLSIPLIGRGMVKIIVESGLDSLEKLGSSTVSELAAIQGVGLGRAEAFYQGIRSNSSLICQLFSVGVTAEASKVAVEGHMKNKVMVMTGFRDKNLAAAFEAAGGLVKDGVSKGTTYLVAKDVCGGSGKLQKARDMGIVVLDLAGMTKILGGV